MWSSAGCELADAHVQDFELSHWNSVGVLENCGLPHRDNGGVDAGVMVLGVRTGEYLTSPCPFF